MEDFKTLLEAYDAIIRQENLSVYEKLEAPRSYVEISEFISALGIDDEDWRTLFSWKNGYDPDNKPLRGIELSQFGIFLSSENIMRAEEDGETEALWPKFFIPLMGDGRGQFVLYNNKPGNGFRSLYLYSVSLLIIQPVLIYKSLYTLLQTDIEAYKQGVLKLTFMNGISFLNRDITKYYEIAEKYNPDVKFWKD